MFVLLLLATNVAGEWVEIAQHQHRAETPRKPSFSHDRTSEANKIYSNYSSTESAWHRNGLPRIPNFGSVKRVQLQSKEKNTFSAGVLSQSALTKEESSEKKLYESVSSVRAPSIKRTKSHLDNTRKINETNIRFHNSFKHFDLEIEKIHPEDFEALNTNTNIKEEKKQVFLIGKKDNLDETNLNKKDDPSFSDIGISKGVHIGKEPDVNIKRYLVERNKANKNTANRTHFEGHTVPPLQLTSSNPFIKHLINNDHFDQDEQIEIENATEASISQQNIKDKSDYYIEPNFFNRDNLKLGGKTKTDTVEVILKLMKILTDNISRNTRRSFKSKIRYLEDLRNNIIANIAERVEQAWPDDAGKKVKGARRTRSARGHVEFPSSESALMTISFLTFAVFLIKLVLQVIHTYKNKTMMVTPAVVAAVGRAAFSAAAVTATSLKEHIHP